MSAATNPKPVLWLNPTDIKERNLYYGPGGKHEPQPPFTFVKEDLDGTNPKFNVRDAAGTKWKAKLGVEAQPETVATRLLWAVGFIANENYLLQDIKVEELPRLKRGRKLIGANGRIHFVRLQKPPQIADNKKLGRWKWKDNPFKGTTEFNGLRVMMALINNWDLKDENTAIYADRDTGAQLFEVSDLGASFGMSGQSYLARRAKNNLAGYRRSKFITKVTRDYVSFDTPSHLSYVYAFRVTLFIAERRQRWIGQRIPRADVKWIASLLAQLSPQQIRDAFRAGGYSPEQVESYATTLESRIAELNRL